VALAARGRWDGVLPLLRHRPDPTVRSYLIDRLGPGGVEAGALMGLLEKETEGSVRRALVLAVGEHDASLLPPAQRGPWIGRLAALYRDDPDPGMHAAAGWLLGQWGQRDRLQEVDRSLTGIRVEGGRKWYVNGQGQTLVVLPPGTFRMGKGEEAKEVHIDHGLALAAREVTVAEFLRFRKDHEFFPKSAPTPDCPVHGVKWYDAAAYCNWLSAQEGIPKEQWCYLPNDRGEYAAGMTVPADYLRRTGYRLPTEQEWEYACRAGSATDWSMGDAEDLLRKYAWYHPPAEEHSHPVGSLRPNDWGLFDLHGNAWEWCQGRFDGQEDKEGIQDKDSRLLRGGAFPNPTADARAAFRNSYAPAERNVHIGFRPARTFR
jgi:formylglycine-generating enzyme required for sulfatase activity